jgi:hypothetical protein
MKLASPFMPPRATSPVTAARVVGLSVVIGVVGLVFAALACERERHHPATEPAITAPPTIEPETPHRKARRAAHARLEQNDLEGALRLLRDSLPAPEDTSDEATAHRCDYAAVLSRRAAGSDDLRARDVDLRLALASCPGDVVLRRNLAGVLWARARAADDDSARLGFLRESVEFEPTAAALVDLALLYERQDEPSEAAAAAARAEALAPNEGRLKALTERLARTASVEQTFKSARHSHFVARFEGHAEERLAWTALDLLEKDYFAVGKVLDLYPTERITVVIYTGDQYRKATNGPDWSAGLFDGKIRIREGQLAADQGVLEDTLMHEYVHAALATLPVPVPPWFHEGLAQHFEGRSSPAPLLARLGAIDRASLDVAFPRLAPDVVPQAYLTAHALVERLVERRGQWGLNQLIAELKSGRDFPAAIQSTFAIDVEQLYREALSSP